MLVQGNQRVGLGCLRECQSWTDRSGCAGGQADVERRRGTCYAENAPRNLSQFPVWFLVDGGLQGVATWYVWKPVPEDGRTGD